MTQYIPIRKNGRLLFEYNPLRDLIRVRRGKLEFIVDLAAEAAEATGKRPFTKDEAVAAVKKVVER